MSHEKTSTSLHYYSYEYELYYYGVYCHVIFVLLCIVLYRLCVCVFSIITMENHTKAEAITVYDIGGENATSAFHHYVQIATACKLITVKDFVEPAQNFIIRRVREKPAAGTLYCERLHEDELDSRCTYFSSKLHLTYPISLGL